MKAGSILERIVNFIPSKGAKKTNKKLFLYEPMMHENRFLDIPVIKDLKEFKENAE